MMETIFDNVLFALKVWAAVFVGVLILVLLTDFC